MTYRFDIIKFMVICGDDMSGIFSFSDEPCLNKEIGFDTIFIKIVSAHHSFSSIIENFANRRLE